ncbi:hypothetical protein TNIN_482721 [Trichonephila inaurata madagascariensis]|uniref:Uncharacterized protein n=1 Tax=Trichonephila inaurata madagascariensis TaxID=2747483 RepID=A0A8X6XV24_9ARAC|nr:hypothetical protein TNIN_482721 [Trichonephila inaurata madagascariensis]
MLKNSNLNVYRESLRNNFANIREEAIGLAKKWGITPKFEKKRHRKVRQFFDDFNADEKLQDRERLFEVDVFKANVDVITTQLKIRFEKERLSYLSLISIEVQEARKIELDELITDFAKKNVRRQSLFL